MGCSKNIFFSLLLITFNENTWNSRNISNYLLHFQIDDTNNTKVTAQQAWEWGIRIAQHLRQLKLDENDVIGIVALNTTYVLPAAIGCLFNGTPIHTINPKLDLGKYQDKLL